MHRIRGGRTLAAALLVGWAVTGVAAGPARAGAVPPDEFASAAAVAFPDEIRGTVTFNGCVVPPTKISVRAVPLP